MNSRNTLKRLSIIVSVLWLLLVSTMLESAVSIKYTYDPAGRLIEARYSTGVSIHYSYDAVGNLLQRRVALEFRGLYFPFYQAGPGTFVGFAVSNYSDEPANLEFTAFDETGTVANFANNPAPVTLEGGTQLARLGWEIFGADPVAVRAGWIRLDSDNPDVGSFFLVGDNELTQMDGSVALTRQSKTFYLTRVFEGPNAYRGAGASTWISVANPNPEPITLELKFHALSQGGTSAEQNFDVARRMISAEGYLFANLGELFGEDSLPLGWVEGTVIEGPGALAFALIKLLQQTTLIGLNASFGNIRSESFSAQVAERTDVIFTSLKLINVSDQPRHVTLRVVREEGGDLADPVEMTLQPDEFLERDTREIFDFSSALPAIRSEPVTDLDAVGSLHVTADGPGVIGDIVFGDPISLRYAASMPLQTQELSQAVFSHVAQVNSLGFFTGIALYNPNQVAASVTIQVLTPEGESIGESTEELGPGRRISKLVDELVDLSQDQYGGYIVITSSQPIVAQQLFGLNNLNLLSAVPPKAVP